MTPRIYTILLLTLFISTIPTLLAARGWRLFTDREGNSYYYDQAGKIRIRDLPGSKYCIVSAIGIDYYIHYGKELLQRHKIPEALRIMKSIIALPVTDERIRKAQVEASQIINGLKRRQGQRFDGINEQASLLLYRSAGIVRIVDDRMRYSMNIPGMVTVIRKRDRKSIKYRYSGILIGIKNRNEQADENEAYDLVIALDSEKYAIKFKNLKEAEEKWKNNLGDGAFIRESFEKDTKHVIYRFKNKTPPIYSGIEGVFVNGQYSYIVRIITPAPSYAKNTALINKIIKSFDFVSSVKKN